MLAYQVSGSGFPVVYLHGFCENKALWTDFTARLPQHYLHLALDLPGFGESAANLHYQTMEALAEEVAAQLDALQIEKAVFVCHSLGGYVALALAATHPSLFAGLCMFHSTALADSEERKNSRNKTADFIRSKGIAAFLESFVPGLFYKGRREALALEIEKIKALALQTPAETAVAVTLAMRDRPDRTAVLVAAAFPVLFIAGKDDDLLPLETHKSQFFLPAQMSLHVLPETGHLGMVERPTETTLILEGFFKAIVLPSPAGA